MIKLNPKRSENRWGLPTCQWMLKSKSWPEGAGVEGCFRRIKCRSQGLVDGGLRDGRILNNPLGLLSRAPLAAWKRREKQCAWKILSGPLYLIWRQWRETRHRKSERPLGLLLYEKNKTENPAYCKPSSSPVGGTVCVFHTQILGRCGPPAVINHVCWGFATGGRKKKCSSSSFQVLHLKRKAKGSKAKQRSCWQKSLWDTLKWIGQIFTLKLFFSAS